MSASTTGSNFATRGAAVAETADVVIVGGGIVGASIAYHLAEAGGANVLVLEREPHLGRGSTGKSMGGVRAQFSTEINIRLSLFALDFFARFEEATGCPGGYRPQGYLFVATNEKHLAYLRTNYQLQVACGVKTVELLSPAEVLRRMPHLRADDILGGSFSSTDGFVDPHSVMTGFMQRATEKGVRLWKGAEATAILQDAQGIAGVDTPRGRVTTRTVVNAAGPWAASSSTGRSGIARRTPAPHVGPTEPFPLIAREAPMTIDMATGFTSAPRAWESCSPGMIRRRRRDSNRISTRHSSRRFFCAPWTAFPALKRWK